MKQTTDLTRRLDDTKLLWHMDRVIEHYDKNIRIPPIHIDCGLTKRCQISCRFCYGYFQKMSGAMISRKGLIDNIVVSAAKIGVRSLGFIGDGEPTLNPAWIEALVLGKKLGLSMAISTNGILVNTDEARDAVTSSCEWMRFNICSSTQEGYKKIHGVDIFDKVIKNIRDFMKWKKEHGYTVDTGLQMVFVPTMMMDEVVPLAELAVELGVDYMIIKQCSLPDEGETGISNFDINLYDDEQVIDVLKKAEALSTTNTKIIPKWNIIKLKGEKNYGSCVGVQLLPEISGDGGIYPCAYFFGGRRPDLCYGNVNEQSLEEIINSEKYWEIVKYMNNFDPKIGCKGSCRQDKTNEFIWNYLHPPKGLNFI